MEVNKFIEKLKEAAEAFEKECKEFGEVTGDIEFDVGNGRYGQLYTEVFDQDGHEFLSCCQDVELYDDSFTRLYIQIEH